MTLDDGEFLPCKQCRQPMRITDARCGWCGVSQPGAPVVGPSSTTAARALMVASFAWAATIIQFMVALRRVNDEPLPLWMKAATAAVSVALIIWALALSRRGYAETSNPVVSGRGQVYVARGMAWFLAAAWIAAVILGFMTRLPG